MAARGKNWDGQPATSTPDVKQGYEGVDIPVPYKNDLRPNMRNARPPVSGPREVLRFAQGHQFAGDVGAPPTDWMQGSQSPADARFVAENPSGTRRHAENKDPRPGTMQPLINRSPVAKRTD